MLCMIIVNTQVAPCLPWYAGDAHPHPQAWHQGTSNIQVWEAFMENNHRRIDLDIVKRVLNELFNRTGVAWAFLQTPFSLISSGSR